MARRRYRDGNDGNSIWEFVGGIFILYLFWIGVLYLTNRAEYWRQVVIFTLFIVVVVAGTFAWKKFQYRRKQKKLNNLLNSLKQNGLEDYVKNFINRFGMQKGKKGDWIYRGHSFDWEQLKDFRKVLNEKGMHLSFDKLDEVSSILHYYIQESEEALVRESISLNPKKFSDLSGSDFENLLYRLFVAMGYSVQKTGRTGDQGADLIVNLNGQRMAIQAKCYAETVGNGAVQEVISAGKFYDCNQATVVTNSSFTREAIELAKVSNVELISGVKLGELLLRYLKESWS